MTRTLAIACSSVLTAIVAGLAFIPSPAAAQPAAGGGAGDTSVTAITEPSKRIKRAFNGLGVIAKVDVKEGDRVKADQVVMVQDQEIEAIELERLHAEANSAARIEFAEADLAAKREVLKRKTAGESGVFSASEIEEATLDVVSREKSLEIAKLDQSQNKLKARQQEAKVVRMNLSSPIDGVVEKIEVWEGEMADPSRPAIIIVKNDPMYVALRDLNTRQVAKLGVGETLDVKYPDEANWQKAKITFIAPVADAQSDTQLVRLEMPNPNLRATGLPIQVKLPAKLVERDAGNQAAVNR